MKPLLAVSLSNMTARRDLCRGVLAAAAPAPRLCERLVVQPMRLDLARASIAIRARRHQLPVACDRRDVTAYDEDVTPESMRRTYAALTR